MQRGARPLRPVGAGDGQEYRATTEHVHPAYFWSVGVEPSPSSRSEFKAAFSLSKGEALTLVLLLSFGLWAAIWGLSPCSLWAGGGE
jgi:hypothetical protein